MEDHVVLWYLTQVDNDGKGIVYNSRKCAVIDGLGSSEWLEVKAGVKQGFMSRFLFLLAIYWVIRKDN